VRLLVVSVPSAAVSPLLKFFLAVRWTEDPNNACSKGNANKHGALGQHTSQTDHCSDIAVSVLVLRLLTPWILAWRKAVLLPVVRCAVAAGPAGRVPVPSVLSLPPLSTMAQQQFLKTAQQVIMQANEFGTAFGQSRRLSAPRHMRQRPDAVRMVREGA
jgi:hypothetical protein